jgi:hypothetical protein
MKDFEYYLEEDVRKRTPDAPLAKSLVLDMLHRISDANTLDIDKFPKIVFESMYDALRDFCDALLAIQGYKSYSHEASISFLKKEGFDIAFVAELDDYRQKRNASKYNGAIITAGDARAIKDFYAKSKEKINSILRKQGL